MQRFAVLAALAASASAYHVSINNNCDKTAYIWSVGDSMGEMHSLEPGAAAWTEDFYTKSSGGGPSVYVADNPERSNGHAQFEYFWDGSKVWYDLSLIDGDPFGSDAVSLGSDLKEIPYDACKPVQCTGVGPCNAAYLTHDQLLGTHDCPPSNLVMHLCDNSGEWNAGDDSSDDDASASPAPSPSAPAQEEQPAESPAAESPAAESPAPVVTPAPAPLKAAPIQQDAEGNPVAAATAFATTIVTKVVSVAAPAPAAASPDGVWIGADNMLHGKRDAHVHEHARAHSRLFRRHNHNHQA